MNFPKGQEGLLGNYFSVVKDASSARAIIDLRTLNDASQRKEVSFSLLSVGGILELLRETDVARHRLRAVHLDIRNAHYQIPIREKLRRRCCIRFGDTILQSCVLPMGYKKACGICQALVWGALLNLTAEERRELYVPEEDVKWTEAQGCLRLQDGGLIIVVYDSLCFYVSSHLQMRWKDILIRNFELRARLSLKYITAEKHKAEFTFCGISLRQTPLGLTWSIDNSLLKAWQVSAQAPIEAISRVYSRFLGFLRFAVLLLSLSRRILGRFTKIQSDLGQITEWDKKEVNLEEPLAMILEMISTIRVVWSHRLSFATHVNKDSVLFASDATPTRWSACIYQDNGTIQHHLGDAFEEELQIEHAEAIAFEKSFSFALPITIIGAVDNTCVDWSIEKGFSVSKNVDKIVNLILQKLKVSGVHLIIADLLSEENVADSGTRSKAVQTKEFEFRQQATFAVLQQALQKYKNCGTTLFSREHRIKLI